LSKAIGGSLPLSVVVYREALDTWAPGAHAGTFRGNQMAMAAGSAVIRTLENENLVEHAAAMGQRLQAHLCELQQRHPELGDVRGRGLMLGVEIIDPRGEADALGRGPQSAVLASAVQRECLKRGLILELGGRHGSVVRFLPPLIVSAEQIDQIARIFAKAVAAALIL